MGLLSEKIIEKFNLEPRKELITPLEYFKLQIDPEYYKLLQELLDNESLSDIEKYIINIELDPRSKQVEL